VTSLGGTCLTNATNNATWPTSDRETKTYLLSVAPVTQCNPAAHRSIRWDIRLHGSEDMTARVELSLFGSNPHNYRLDCNVDRGQRYRCEARGSRLDIRYQP
jgi:hypothetical protein